MNPFENAEVIHSYGDAQAIEDGMIGALNGRDRFTSALIHWLSNGGEIIATQVAFDRLMALAEAKGADARYVYENNLEGGIYRGDLKHTFRDEKREVWLLPNENDGITIMFPEDY